MSEAAALEPLPPNDVELWKALEDQLGADAFLTRIPHVSGVERETGGRFLIPWHARPIAEVAARIRRGERVRVLIGMPPRHSKTENILNIAPWVWERRPIPVMYVTYAENLAKRKSRRCMEIARATGWKVRGGAQFWGVQNGGTFQAAGVGGQIAGEGAGLLLVDDPFRDREEAESALMRQKIYDWFTDVAYARLSPKGSCIVLHHRWHDDDLIGRLMEQGGWESIVMPAIGPDGRALWPERYPVDRLEEIKVTQGPYGWSSLYQQDPQPKGGRLFGKEFGRYEWPSKVEKCKFILAACDPAATEDTHNDMSAITIGAFYMEKRDTGHVPVLDVLWHWADHLEIPDVAKKLKWVSEHWGCPVVVETIGAFKSVAQTLKRIAPGARVIPIDSVKDKFIRSQPAAAAWRNAQIRLPLTADQAPWLPDLLRQMLQFTGIGDAHDDRVDSLVHLWNTGYSVLCRPQRGLVPMRPGAFA